MSGFPHRKKGISPAFSPSQNSFKTRRIRQNANSPASPALLHHYEQLEMRETLTDRRKTVAVRLGKGTSEDVEVSKSNEYLRKWREIQQTNNLLQRPEIYRSQKRKKPRFAARPYEYWCPDSESNQGHGDFQSL